MSAFLDLVRDNSAYPVFRGVTTLLKFVGYLAAVVIAITGLLVGKYAIVAGLIAAAIIAVLTRLFTEMSLMIADIADTVIQSAASSAQKQEAEGGIGTPATPTSSESLATTSKAAIDIDSQRYADPSKLRFMCPQCDTGLVGDEATCYKCGSILNAPDGWRLVPKK